MLFSLPNESAFPSAETDRAEEESSPEPQAATLCLSRSLEEAAPQSWPVLPGYQILGEAGRGALGVVYRAVQAGTNRLVALKMIRSGSQASLAERKSFRAEAEAVALFQHPNIVQIHEVGTHQGLPFLAFEFMAGGSLEKWLAGKPRPVREAAALVETLARAVAYAHAHGIIHRDLKPDNVLLAPGDVGGGSPLVKITDFGLARRLDEVSSTHTGVIKGTPSYMAPEQALGKAREIGPAVDIYALGAILYQVLTGRPPFAGTTVVETLALVCHQEPLSPRQLQPGVPRDLETICLKCLQKDWHQRYVSAEALAEDLRRFLAGEPIQARPTPSWERLGKWVRRKPFVAGFIAVSLVAWLAIAAALVFYARFKAEEADLARRKVEQVTVQEKARGQISASLDRARQHMADKQWVAADREIASALAALEALPGLRAEDVRDELLHCQAVVRQQLEEQEQREQALGRYRRFEAASDDALFYETLFTGLGLASNRSRALAAARTALGIYGLDGKPTPDSGLARLERDQPFLSAGNYRSLTAGCYELLLVWAEIEASGVPGQARSEEQSRHGAENALTLLAQAAVLGKALGLETRTYHRRKARYLAQSQGKKVDPTQVAEAEGSVPMGALDWFLSELEHYQAGQYELACRDGEEVLRQQQNHFWAKYVRALCHLRANRWLEGKEDLTVCLNRRPTFVWPLLVRGFAATELGFRAVQHAEQAAHAKGSNTELARMYRRAAEIEFSSAQADFDQALGQELDSQARYVGLANRGVLLIRRKRWTEAVRDLETAVQLNPRAYPAYVSLAQALQGAGKGEEALVAMNQAIQRAPNLPELYEARARLRLERGQRSLARADFERAIALEPKDSKSELLVRNLVELGQLLHREHQYPAALASFDRALQLNPEFVQIQRFRARTLLQLNRIAEAGQALDRYLAGTREPPAEVSQERGLIHARAGQLPAAIEMYSAALRLNPKDTVTRCLRGWAYLMTDAVRLALEDFEVCLKENPQSADALAGRGNARIRLKQLDGALADAEEAEKQGPVTDRLLYNLTRIHAQAVGLLEVEARTSRTALTAQRLALSEARALRCLRRTLEEVPQDQRATFWREQVQTDPALAAIRKGAMYSQMAGDYGQVTR